MNQIVTEIYEGVLNTLTTGDEKAHQNTKALQKVIKQEHCYMLKEQFKHIISETALAVAMNQHNSKRFIYKRNLYWFNYYGICILLDWMMYNHLTDNIVDGVGILSTFIDSPAQVRKLLVEKGIVTETNKGAKIMLKLAPGADQYFDQYKLTKELADNRNRFLSFCVNKKNIDKHKSSYIINTFYSPH